MTGPGPPTRSRSLRAATTAWVLGCIVLLGSCSNDAQRGAWLGAGVGALAGHAVGGDARSTLIGAAAGAGAGYIIGNESDRRKGR